MLAWIARPLLANGVMANKQGRRSAPAYLPRDPAEPNSVDVEVRIYLRDTMKSS
jgi:hypothetical protein